MYTKEDFKKCHFNPFHKELFRNYSRLMEIKDILKDEKDAEGVVRFIIAAYDPESPLIKDYPEQIRRKQEAARLFGLEDEEGLVSFHKESYVNAAHWYLRNFVKSMDWAVIQANTETFWEYQLRLMTPIAKEEKSREKDMMSAIQVKSKLAEDLSLIAERIQKHTKSFYGGDEELIKADNKIRYNSESIANVFQNY